MSAARVLVSCIHLQETIDRYRKDFAERRIEIDLPEIRQQLTEPELLEIIDRYDGVIAGDDHFTAKVMEKAVKLKIISKWGVGVDAIDREAAAKRGIKVTNTPNVFGNEVADVTMGYIILLARQLHRMHESVRSGGWLKVRGHSLSGMTLGIIGLGDIGRSVAARASGHGMRILGHDVIPPLPDTLRGMSVTMSSLNDLLAGSEYVALCCNLTAANRHMLSHPQFSMMKKGGYLVNTARGPLVDEDALADALADGRIAGAALDVFETEPLPSSSRLRAFEQCIFGTHNSSNTIEAVLRVNEMAIENLLKGLNGGFR